MIRVREVKVRVEDKDKLKKNIIYNIFIILLILFMLIKDTE